MALTDTAVHQAKPSGKNSTLKDSGGLALFVSPKGGQAIAHFAGCLPGSQP